MKATTRAARAASPSSPRTARCSTSPAPAFEYEVGQCRPLSGGAQQEGHRAGGHRGRRLRRGQAHLRGVRARPRSSASTRTPAPSLKFIQLLPSGIGPEGLVAIPSRNLLVTANETDLGEDGLARSHVMVFERAEGPAAYPMMPLRSPMRACRSAGARCRASPPIRRKPASSMRCRIRSMARSRPSSPSTRRRHRR